MNLKSLRTLTLLLIQVPAISNSSVNMKDGNYHRSWIDGGILNRTYNSRSLHKGLFGFGWCSDLELKLEIGSDNSIRLEECGTSKVFSQVSTKPSLYIYGQQRLDRNKAGFVLSAPGRTWTFDPGGRLMKWRRGPEEVALDFDADGRPLRMRSRRLGSWTLSYSDDQRKIIKIGTSHGREVFYFYGGENLTQTVDSGRAPISLLYDTYHNLIRIKGLTDENISYDIARDLVTELQRADGCKESFQYTRSTGAFEILEVATADVECDGFHSNIVHEFIYITRPKGGTLLSRVKSTVNGEPRGNRTYSERGPASRIVPKGA
jgi:hypothetical protein